MALASKSPLLEGNPLQAAALIRARYPANPYVGFHAPRYATLLRLLSRHLQSSDSKVLDIGPSVLTDLVAECFLVHVDTLGFGDHQPPGKGTHYRFDMNDSKNPEAWPNNLPKYDVVILAEVLEHLRTSPFHVMSFIRTLLSPRGFLVIQTPNAATLGKRLKLLGGRNPYELISEDPGRSGHAREYTEVELRTYARRSGMTVEVCSYRSYFDQRFRTNATGHAPHSSLFRFLTLAYG